MVDVAEGTPTAEQILQIGFGFWASKTLLRAIELEVFTGGTSSMIGTWKRNRC